MIQALSYAMHSWEIKKCRLDSRSEGIIQLENGILYWRINRDRQYCVDACVSQENIDSCFMSLPSTIYENWNFSLGHKVAD